jgi:hypothetical protein
MNEIINKFFENLQPYDVGEQLMRFGADSDGGYVVPLKSLYLADIFYTYGVGGEISFENDISSFCDNEFYFFDPTVHGLPTPKPQYKFFREGLGTAPNCYSYETHIKRFKHENKKILLKVDVEGAEYGNMDKIPLELMDNITGIVMEIHNLHDANYMNQFDSIANHLKQRFTLCHTHLNNFGSPMQIGEHKLYNAIEVTYINTSLCNSPPQLPYWKCPIMKLDKSNNKNIPDVELSFLKKRIL